MLQSERDLGNFIQPLTVGTVTLSGRAILAPMSGVTDVGMRRLAMRFGGSLVVSEMVASDDYVRGAEESRIRAEGAGVEPHVVQIAGRDPHWMAEAAKLAESSGAAIVDINMGCPAKKVTGGYAGSALMRDLDHALTLIEATVAAVKILVTLKMRLGWDDRSHNAAELARRAEIAGVQLITVHGRTRCQFYKGQADWSAIRAVRDAMSLPLVANGDCHAIADAAAMLRLSGADAVMIGRAAVGRPWLVGDIAHAFRTGQHRAELPATVRFAAAIEHYDTLLSLFGESHGLRHARKHLAAYAEGSRAAGHPEFAALRTELVTTNSPDQVRRLLLRLCDMDAAASLQEAA